VRRRRADERARGSTRERRDEPSRHGLPFVTQISAQREGRRQLVYASGVDGSLVTGGDGRRDEEGSFELVAASLRASSGDLRTFVEVLADKLERALPGRVEVERRGVRPWSREKRVERLQLALGENRYLLAAQAGKVETRCAKAVRGVVLKTEALSLDAWLEALARDLQTEARTSEQSRLALEQLLRT
jgi:hypothetical protein